MKRQKPKTTPADFGELLRDADEVSVASSAITHDPTSGKTRSHVQIKPSERDPALSNELDRSPVVQLYKLFSGLCCGGLPGNYAVQMLNSRKA